MMKNTVKYFVVFLLGSLCSACSNQAGDKSWTESFNETVFALRTSVQLNDMGLGGDKAGDILLIKDDGTYDTVSVGAMDVGQLEWGKSGLFGSELESEILLNADGVKKFERPGTQELEAYRNIREDGDSYYSLYNKGWVKESYTMLSVYGNSTGFESWESSGNILTVMDCGSAVYGVSDLTETKYAPKNMQNGEYQALVKLYPKPQEQDYIVGKVGAKGYEHLFSGMTCIDSAGYSLAQHYEVPGDYTSAVVNFVRKWNLTDGTVSDIRMVDASGKPFELKERALNAEKAKIIDNTMYWIDSTEQDLYRTILDTGETALVFSPAKAGLRLISGFELHGTSLFGLSIGDKANDVPVLFEYNLESGKMQRIVEVPDLKNSLTGDLVPRDIAINPEWLRKQKL